MLLPFSLLIPIHLPPTLLLHGNVFPWLRAFHNLLFMQNFVWIVYLTLSNCAVTYLASASASVFICVWCPHPSRLSWPTHTHTHIYISWRSPSRKPNDELNHLPKNPFWALILCLSIYMCAACAVLCDQSVFVHKFCQIIKLFVLI